MKNTHLSRLVASLLSFYILCCSPLSVAFAKAANETRVENMVLTKNSMGWMLEAIDPISQKFLDLCREQPGLHALEIGAAYGFASLKALELDAHMTVNDLDEEHLDIFLQKVPEKARSHVRTLPGDFTELPLDQVGPFKAILAVRVLHFFSPEKLRRAAQQMYDLLEEGGKVFIVADTPYIGSFKKFIPLYEERKKNQEPYPGYMKNSREYFPLGAFNLPESLHPLDPEVLTREFENAGFTIEWAGFMTRPDYPSSIQYDGRESAGLVAIKRSNNPD